MSRGIFKAGKLADRGITGNTWVIMHGNSSYEIDHLHKVLPFPPLPGKTEVLPFLPTGLNTLPPPPVWVASAVIGEVASRLQSIARGEVQKRQGMVTYLPRWLRE